MKELEKLFDNNKAWVEENIVENPKFFERLAEQQSPEYLWIGCSDSRVPACEILGLGPGELFVHRNVANVVAPDDVNCLSVLQYAVDALKVKHVILCGHYGCGGVAASLKSDPLGLIDGWLAHIRASIPKHQAALDAAPDDAARSNLLCELNVIEQAANVCRTKTVQDAWGREQALTIHGWIYDLATGRIRDLRFHVSSTDMLNNSYENAISLIAKQE
jgi:carbonic anhydrase